MKYSLSILICVLAAYCLSVGALTTDYTRFVDPFIGTGGHGHTFPGAVMPFGMVALSPDTRIDNWDGSSGYHYSDDVIYGFSHTHLSGTGIPDGCDILLMPTVGRQLFKTHALGYPTAKFSHKNEHAEPGYYSAELDVGIHAELTTTNRVGLHKYTFPKGADPNIVIDLRWRDKLTDQSINVVGNNRVEGFRRSSSWAKDQTVYFVAEFSEPFSPNEVDMEANQGPSSDQKGAKYNFHFNASKTNEILIKVAISYVSIEGARKNLEAELPGWDFDKVRADAKAAWNKELSKIEVSGGTPEQTKTFYTALYHTMIHPSVFNDVDGNYLGHDKKVHQLPGYPAASRGKQGPLSTSQYTVFSLWDTFRAAHPLYTIIDEKRTVGFINSFIRIYEQGGRLPVWELWGNETDCMIGYHAVPVIADAMAKGIKGFDYEKAYEAAKHSAELDHFGLAAYKKRGYISSEDENESVSKTLEYAFDDWCIASMGQLILHKRLMAGKAPQNNDGEKALEAEIDRYFTRSQNYRNLFDPSVGFARPKRNGGFLSPFKPNEVTFNFTEGNSWVYTFFAPHDISALSELYGGKIEFAKKLDELFTTSDKLAGREQPDITGLIGQYAHGNEPSHHIAYLYNYAGQPWKTQMYVSRILNEFYKAAPDGLIGNEDCGQMSAWYVLSSLGFYEVNPARPLFDIGTPLFKEAKVHLENGKTFTIKAPNASPANKYIASVKLNGRPFRSTTFSNSDLKSGATLEFTMAAEPVKDWFDAPSVSEVGVASAVVPVIEGERVFTGSTTINIKAPLGGAVHWRRAENGAAGNWTTDIRPFEISDTTTITAYTETQDGKRSPDVTATFYRRPNDWSVRIVSPYDRQYTGGGDDAIVDGLRGTANFASGEWQGYQGRTFEAIIDLKRDTTISEVGGSFLQAAGSWIWMPADIKFEISDDGSRWTPIADIKTDVPQTLMENTTKEFRRSIAPVKARYVRVRAFNIGKIPGWHAGAGGDPWIFVDEIIIK